MANYVDEDTANVDSVVEKQKQAVVADAKVDEDYSDLVLFFEGAWSNK